MADVLACLLATGSGGVRRDETDRLHHRRPFLVVVAGARGLAEVMLPQMHHLMHERGEVLLGGARPEMRRVEGNLIGSLPAVQGAEAAPGKIAVGFILALHGDEATRQLAVKEALVKEIVGGGEIVIGSFSRVSGR